MLYSIEFVAPELGILLFSSVLLSYHNDFALFSTNKSFPVCAIGQTSLMKYFCHDFVAILESFASFVCVLIKLFRLSDNIHKTSDLY